MNNRQSVQALCSCGYELFSGICDVSSLVELFEHVNASGLPNFQCCRIPIINSGLKMLSWYRRLEDYEDKIVCQFLEFGFPLDFDKSKKLLPDIGRNHKGAINYPEFINAYVSRECQASRIVGPFEANPLSVPLIVSPMNSVPKSVEGDRRVIVDLSWPRGGSVNEGISKDTYLNENFELHYTSVEEVCRMVLEIGPGAVIYKRDLKHAYRQIPVDPKDYCYLGYYWEDMWYFDTVLAMGQRNAAMACSRTTNAVMYIHNEDGHNGTSYLDDLIGVAKPQDGTQGYNHLGELLSELGLLENTGKACPPATIQTVLGVQIDTVNMTISVTEERLEETINLLKSWSKKRSASKTELQSLIGKLVFITKCVRQSRLFLNRMLNLLRSMTPDVKRIKLSKSFMKDVRWWREFLYRFNGMSFIPPISWSEPDVTFSTDSSLRGCGGFCTDEFFHIEFPNFIDDQDLPIHCLELLAVLVAVRSWGHRYGGGKVQIFCDNEASVKVINSGKTTDMFMASCLRELWLEVSRFKFELRAIHLPGVDNRVADWLSRWEVHPRYQELFWNFNSDGLLKEIFISNDKLMFSGNL